jgi:hypothetical protein
MDVAGIAKLSTSMAETGTNQAVGIAALKKAQDIQASTATQMIEAIKAAPTVQNLPGHLGNTVNTSA